MKHLLQMLIGLCLPLFLYSQPNTGQFNVQFSLNSVDCVNSLILVDVEVQASSPATIFRITDQNYRFSFNRGAILPIGPPVNFPDTNPLDLSFHIAQELTLSGFVARDGAFSFFDPHTLTGSTDTIISYNIRLAGGDGYPVYDDEWVSVGRLRIYFGDDWVAGSGLPPPPITSPVNDPIHLRWHTHDPADFPNTFIGEKFNGAKVEAAEGTYYNFDFDPFAACGFSLPIELAYFKAFDRGCEVELEWKTDSETDNDYFIIEESSDGISFRPLATVDGSGTTATALTYEFIDQSVDVENYYRLKQVDFDGTSSTSPAIYIRSSCYDDHVVTGIAEIFPNPLVPGKPLKLKVFTNKDVEEAEILISDVLGRVIIRKTVSLMQGGNNLTLDLNRLAMGAYFVHAQGVDWISDPAKFLKIE